MSDGTGNRDTVKVGSIGRPPPRKRFYELATVAPHVYGFAVVLDGRVARTPAGKPLAVGSEAVAGALAAEWSAQGERLDPAAMPLTRLMNSAIDGVSAEMTAVRADVVRYAEGDLVCYRAEEPEGLVALQDRHWTPLVDYVRGALGARLALAGGIIHVGQDRETLKAIDAALQGYDALALAAIHTVTTLTGSAVIAIAVARGVLSPEAAWTAAHVDEDWQMSQWGKDELALDRRALRWREMAAAGLVLSGAQGIV
jgi:chaperone required for assembly of F1-ATPase